MYQPSPVPLSDTGTKKEGGGGGVKGDRLNVLAVFTVSQEVVTYWCIPLFDISKKIKNIKKKITLHVYHRFQTSLATKCKLKHSL